MLQINDLQFCETSVSQLQGGAFHGKVLQTDIKTGLKTLVELDTDVDVKQRSGGYQAVAGAAGGGVGAASLHGQTLAYIDLGLAAKGAVAKRAK
jgi:hypothetical protein